MTYDIKVLIDNTYRLSRELNMRPEDVEQLSTFEVIRYADLLYQDSEKEAEKEKALYKMLGPLAAIFSLKK